ncbi:hypothetical protein Cgig2_026998 [Carnegiea gigantea]|uniref:Uncharacterized protein n=1 Tax=Carnegiea gigantea TaxID=171969 RepID=A0A9Q1JW72_9CARY|nr:hypothetical protein Cgig2_026998 [Carnegiea gigantea]
MISKKTLIDVNLIVKFSYLNQAKSYQLKEPQELISSKKDDDKQSRIDFAYFVSIRSSFTVVRITLSWSFTTLINSIDNLISTKIGQYTSLERNNPRTFMSGCLRCLCPQPVVHMPMIPKGFQSDLSDTNIPKNNGIHGSKPKLKIAHYGNPLESFVSQIKHSFYVMIPRIDVVIPATHIPAFTIESIESVNNIIDILDVDPNLTESIGESDNVNSKEELAHIPLTLGTYAPSLVPCPQHPLKSTRSCFHFIVDFVIKEVDKCAALVFDQAILDKVSHTPFNGILSLQANLKNLYTIILQRGSYSYRTTIEEKDRYCIEAQSKLDEASQWLSAKVAHYKAVATELKQEHCSSQVATNKHLLQETKHEVINVQCHIDIINPTNVTDSTTKASLEKTEAYIKENFEHLRTFQWNP